MINETTVKKESAEEALKRLELLRKEIDEEEAKLSSKENPSLDEMLQALDSLREKTLSVINEIISLNQLPQHEKVTMRFYQDLFASFIDTSEFLLVLSDDADNLKSGLLLVTAELAKIRGATKEIEDIKAKLEDVGKNSVALEKKLKTYTKAPIQMLIQQVIGNVQGNIIQESGSQVNFNQQVNDAFEQAHFQVENRTDVSSELKDKIKKKLEILEQELRRSEPEAGRIQNLWKWLKRNASWVVPTITQVVTEGIKLALGD